MKMAALKPEEYLIMQSTMRRWIIPTLCHSDLELDVVEDGILDGDMLPIAITEDDEVIGAMVLELHDDIVHITCLAGILPKGWHRTILETMTSIAKSQGRSKLQCRGRKGWLRVLKQFGAKQKDEYIQIEVH
jgi:hypothetical protein